MSDLNCKNVMGVLRGDFGALWHCRQLGKTGQTLEITTPYLYPDSTFVTVFVTKRGNRFIINDGGHASEFFQSAKDDEPFFNSLISKAQSTHGVKVCEKGERKFYFKETGEPKLISSVVFDVANFLAASANAASLALAEEDSTDKNSFRLRADTFIKAAIPRTKSVKFNKKFSEIKEASFSAAVSSNSRLWLVMYLTGSNLKYFQLSASNAIFNVELALKSSINKQVAAIIPLLNDEAVGYQPTHLTERLGRLIQLTKTPIVPWHRKEEIISQLA